MSVGTYLQRRCLTEWAIEMNKPSLSLKAFLRLIAIEFVVVIGLVASTLFCSLLAPIALLGLIVVLIGEWRRVFAPKNWLRYLCWCWVGLILPTFGIMPLLIASRLLLHLPMGKTLGIFAGITYTYIYDFFIPTPELFVWDHPFPPVTDMQLYALGCITTLLTLFPSYCLLKLQRAKSA
jgi:hypothetical protein